MLNRQNWLLHNQRRQQLPSIHQNNTTRCNQKRLPPHLIIMGGFGQKFLVIVSYPDYDVMEPAHLNALESTIKRKEMSLDDVAMF
jgi:hypothetical protein